MSEKYEGIIPPVITSFDKDGGVYEKGCRNMVEFLLPYVSGYYICGSYGSGPLMEVPERKRVVEVMAEQVNGRALVIPHVGAPSTKATIELAKHAEKTGADAIGIVPPYYYSYPEKNLINHYKAVLDAVNIPVFAYDNPKLSNNTITPKMLAQLAEMGMAGIKDSSFSIISFAEKINAVSKTGFSFIIGTEAQFLPAFLMGARACVSGLANALPKLMHSLFLALKEGQYEKATTLHLKVVKARSILHHAPTITSIHAVLDHLGIDAGFPRMPYMTLDDETKKVIIQELKQTGELV